MHPSGIRGYLSRKKQLPITELEYTFTKHPHSAGIIKSFSVQWHLIGNRMYRKYSVKPIGALRRKISISSVITNILKAKSMWCDLSAVVADYRVYNSVNSFMCKNNDHLAAVS